MKIYYYKYIKQLMVSKCCTVFLVIYDVLCHYDSLWTITLMKRKKRDFMLFLMSVYNVINNIWLRSLQCSYLSDFHGL